MRNVFKWRVATNIYLYITDANPVDGTASYGNPFVFDKKESKKYYGSNTVETLPTGVDEGKIQAFVSNITSESVYRTMYNTMHTFVDNFDFGATGRAVEVTKAVRNLTILNDYKPYFNLDNDVCVEEAVTPKCEGYEPVFDFRIHTVDEHGDPQVVPYEFYPERNEHDKTLRYVLDFEVPKGEKGDKGGDGAGCKGDKGDTGPAGPTPFFNATASATEATGNTPNVEVIVDPDVSTHPRTYNLDFKFEIPSGRDGAPGAPGDDGSPDILTDINTGVERLPYDNEPYVKVYDQKDGSPNRLNTRWNGNVIHDPDRGVDINGRYESSFYLKFGIPEGAPGMQGPEGRPSTIRFIDATVEETLEPGEQAQARAELETLESNNEFDIHLFFKIPRGKDGDSLIGDDYGESDGGIRYNFSQEVIPSDEVDTIVLDWDQKFLPTENDPTVIEETLQLYYPSVWDKRGTVKSITPGDGLVNGDGNKDPITEEGEIKVALVDYDTNSNTATRYSEGDLCAVELDDDGNLAVMVPPSSNFDDLDLIYCEDSGGTTSPTQPTDNENTYINLVDRSDEDNPIASLEIIGEGGTTVSARGNVLTINSDGVVPRQKNKLIYYDESPEAASNGYNGLITEQLMYEDGIVVDNQSDYGICTNIPIEPNIKETFIQFSESPFSPEYGNGFSMESDKHAPLTWMSSDHLNGYGYNSWGAYEEGGVEYGHVIKTDTNSEEFNGYMSVDKSSKIMVESLIGSYDRVTTGDMEGITLVNMNHAVARHVTTTNGMTFFRDAMFDLDLSGDTGTTAYCAWVSKTKDGGAYVVYAGTEHATNNDYWSANEKAWDPNEKYMVKVPAEQIYKGGYWSGAQYFNVSDKWKDSFPHGECAVYYTSKIDTKAHRVATAPTGISVTIEHAYEATGYIAVLNILTENTSDINSVFSYGDEGITGTIYVYSEIIQIDGKNYTQEDADKKEWIDGHTLMSFQRTRWQNNGGAARKQIYAVRQLWHATI